MKPPRPRLRRAKQAQRRIEPRRERLAEVPWQRLVRAAFIYPLRAPHANPGAERTVQADALSSMLYIGKSISELCSTSIHEHAGDLACKVSVRPDCASKDAAK